VVSEETLQGGCSTVVQATGVMDRYGWLLLLFWLAGAARARSALRVVARSAAQRRAATCEPPSKAAAGGEKREG